MIKNKLSIKELATSLNVSEAYIRKEIKNGKIVSEKQDGFAVVDLNFDRNKYLVEKIKEKRLKLRNELAHTDNIRFRKKIMESGRFT